jgi:hypothetical protein
LQFGSSSPHTLSVFFHISASDSTLFENVCCWNLDSLHFRQFGLNDAKRLALIKRSEKKRKCTPRIVGTSQFRFTFCSERGDLAVQQVAS